jgi:putative redox protein
LTFLETAVAAEATLNLARLNDTKMASGVQLRGHSFKVDVNAETGGDDLGPDPHDLYDAALGACKTLTMMWVARRKGLDVQDIQVRITRDASKEREGVYKLIAQVDVKGNLSEADIAALTAAAERCPVQKLMTQAKTEVSTAVTLVK